MKLKINKKKINWKFAMQKFISLIQNKILINKW